MRRILHAFAIIAALSACAAGQPAIAQTGPVVDGVAIPGGDAAIAVTSTVTGRTVRVPARIMLCLSGGNYVACSNSGGGGGGTSPTLDSNGDLRVPTVTVTAFYVSLSANTSTQLLAASGARIAVEIQCTGTAPVGLSSLGSTLTKAVPDGSGAGNVDAVIPAGTTPMYIPLYVSATAITAYSTSAQQCWGKSYARQ